ncbi:MAG: L,D-transpeptidase family protein [Kiritimatiellae bacterium]|nr:L,D-transpeptidase family protein [Kiritimatiellia bacterium]
MQIHDLNDYYKPKSKPLLPWIVGIVIAILVIALIFVSCSKQSKPSTEETTTTEETKEGLTIKEYSDVEIVKEEIAATLSTNEISSAIDQGNKAMQAGKFEVARNFYLSAYEGLGTTDAKSSKDLEDKIGKCSIELFTTPRPMTGKIDYIISSGDSLSGIASKYNCPVDLIMKSNNINNPNAIRPGDRLIFPDHPKFTIKVSKSENTLTLLLDGRFFKKYIVGTGQYNKTPAGTFKTGFRQKDPAWYPGNGPGIPFGDPRNILGTRWIPLEATGDTIRVDGYGIHGTWDEKTLGTQSSAGCVRMSNKDVEELSMLIPRNTEVEIVE